MNHKQRIRILKEMIFGFLIVLVLYAASVFLSLKLTIFLAYKAGPSEFLSRTRSFPYSFYYFLLGSLPFVAFGAVIFLSWLKFRKRR